MSDPLASDLKERGDSRMEAGEYQEALDAYTKALAIQDAPSLHYNQGRAYQALKRYTLALAALKTFEQTADDALLARVPKLVELIASVAEHVGTLQVKCETPHAQLELSDGRSFTLPMSVALLLDQGTHEIKLSAPDYEKLTKRVYLAGGQTTQLSLLLTPIERHAILHVNSQVVGASVFLDGKRVGQTPTELEVLAGTRELRLTHPDHEDATHRIVLKPGEKKQLDLQLEALPRFYQRWWFWTSVGAVAVGTGITLIAINTEKSAVPGDIAPGTISAPLTVGF